MSEAPEVLPLSAVPGALRGVEEQLRALVEGLDEAQLNWQPASDRWSVLQVVDHLQRTAAAYLPVLRTAISKGLAEGARGDAPAKAGWVERLFLRSLQPSSVRLRAPRSVAPTGASDFDPGAVIADWTRLHDDLASEAQRGESLDPTRVRLASPFFALLRLGLGVAFTVIVEHEARHLEQIRRVIADPRFPRR